MSPDYKRLLKHGKTRRRRALQDLPDQAAFSA
jgi:hypothetical protein